MPTPATAAVKPIVPAVRLKSILFATDFSECSMNALPFATSLAKKFGAKVFAGHIVTPTPLAVGAPEAAPYLYQAEIESAERALQDLVQSPALAGLECESRMPSGTLADELESLITQDKIDLVVAGTHGRTGVRRLLLGSSVEEICRVSKVPVLTVGPDVVQGKPMDFKQIVLTTDLSEESTFAMPYVELLAQAYGSSVAVLHVMPSEPATNPDARALAEPVRRAMQHAYEGRVGDPKAEFVVEFGDTVETVLNYARSRNADLIAMGIRRAFLPGFQLRSSVAYRLIAGAHCPVLTCRRAELH